jgi:hypothetical protein
LPAAVLAFAGGGTGEQRLAHRGAGDRTVEEGVEPEGVADRDRRRPAGHYLTVDSVPGSIYAGPISGVMTWRSNQFNRLLRGTWAYTAP